MVPLSQRAAAQVMSDGQAIFPEGSASLGPFPSAAAAAQIGQGEFYVKLGGRGGNRTRITGVAIRHIGHSVTRSYLALAAGIEPALKRLTDAHLTNRSHEYCFCSALAMYQSCCGSSNKEDGSWFSRYLSDRHLCGRVQEQSFSPAK